MADPASSSSSSSSLTTITDLDVDALTRCASYLSLRDVSNVAMSCKYLKTAAYSDSIWQSLYRQEWAHAVPLSSQVPGFREAYISRHTALHQFKYVDPLLRDILSLGKPPSHMQFDKNAIIFSQGSSLYSWLPYDPCMPVFTLGNHKSRITCTRLFSLSEACLYQSDSEIGDNILLTSSSDHFIRLWSKGGYRCFKGHTGPVLTLSDKLIGENNSKIFSSGGEDGTVRLWSINSSGKRGQHALKATLHGHDKAVSLMSVAGHKSSLLVSISMNGKVRVWDTSAASSSSRSSCCVGMTNTAVLPVGMKCHESLIYVAAGSSIVAVDLRTMDRAFTIAHQANIHSFDFLPSKSLLCIGGIDRASLWDIRGISSRTQRSEPAVELEGHVGPIKYIHMDSYKIVTGGPEDANVKVWEVDTGKPTNSLNCSGSNGEPSNLGCSAMAVDGCRIITGVSGYEGNPLMCKLCLRDFKTATCRVSSNISEEASSLASKFWGFHSDSSSDSEEEAVVF